MDLQLKNQLFIVGGASSGFGNAISKALLAEGATVIGIARSKDKLEDIKDSYAQFETLATDITTEAGMEALVHVVNNRQVHGILVNAGGPKAKQTLETTLEDWDDAYRMLLRWKVALVQAFVPKMVKDGYGRIIFIESISVKQPVQNLVLSSSLRVAVVNMAKTLSQEIGKSGVTLNILAPGSHDTPAVDRIYKKESEQTNKPFEEVKANAIKAIPVGRLGDPDDIASLACWLFSPHSRQITGQTISVDGGMVKGIFG